MFLGHFAAAFAAKQATPEVSLGTLFVAAQLADLVWPFLVLAGVERVEVQPGATVMTPLDFVHYPYSHSLLALAFWGGALGLAYRALRRGRWQAVWVLAALVLSHWILDFVVHRPDMPLTPGESARFGLGLWNSVPVTLAIELGLLAACAACYARSTRARDRVGTWAFPGLLAFLVLAYSAAVFGPPPPSGQAVAWSAMAVWLLVAWGYWIDRHRMRA